MCSRGDGFRDLARVANATISHDRHTVPPGRGCALHDGGKLRDTRTSDDAGGADRPRPDSNAKSVCTCFDQVSGTFEGGDVASKDVHIERFLQPLDGFDHPD